MLDASALWVVRLMSAPSVSAIPTAGNQLIIVAVVNQVLHVRIFDGDGVEAVDTDETQLPGQAPEIDDLRNQVASLWPPHVLTDRETSQIIAAVTAIVG